MKQANRRRRLLAWKRYRYKVEIVTGHRMRPTQGMMQAWFKGMRRGSFGFYRWPGKYFVAYRFTVPDPRFPDYGESNWEE